MKKWFVWGGIVVVLLLGVAVFAGGVLAQGPEDGGTTPNGPVDEDGDGVCDICGREIGGGRMRGRMMNGSAADGSAADGGGRGMGSFVDADGDGVCDNLGTGLRGGRR